MGQPVLLAMPPGLDFVVAFLGCLDAGAIAVPCHPPRGRRGLDRLKALVADAQPVVALVDRTTLATLERRGHDVPELSALRCFAPEDLEDELDAWANAWVEPPWGEGLALLQYTSGSTSEPKGVRVGHRHLLHNEAMIQQAFGQDGDSRIVGWLPLYHDMGLIGNVLQPLVLGASCVLMSPVSFLQRPARWLEAITRFRATTSGGPSFAYDLCARRVSEEDRAGLDLSSWSVAFDGAEPVRAATHDRFVEAFGPCGFERRAFFPCYGLAEATLFVSGGEQTAVPTVADFAAEALEEGRAEPADPGNAARRLVGCGRPWGGQRIEIVDPVDRRRLASVDDGSASAPVGEIWIEGESVAEGYWRREDDPATATFGATLADDPAAGPFLRTGDLGFLRDGELFVCGRLKELIVIRGRNHLPIDLEETVRACHSALRPEVAAFSVDDGDDERLVMVAEVRRRPGSRGGPDAETVAGIIRAAREAVAEHHQIELSDLVLIRTGTLPKTTSGKIRRRECRRLYRTHALPVVANAVLVEASPERLAEPAAARSTTVPVAWLEATARVLRRPVSEISAAESLTAQGLDSLAALELQHTLRPLAGAFDLVELLEGLSLEELAVRWSGDDEAAESVETVETSEPPTSVPLTPAQQDLWSLHQRVVGLPAPASGAAQIGVVARLTDPAAFDGLAQGLAELAARHPALRATVGTESVGEREGEPALVFEPGAPPQIVRVDTEGWSAERLETAVDEERFRPLDLTAGPLWRLVLFERGADSRLLLVAHHLVADFWTLARLARALIQRRPMESEATADGDGARRLARAIERRAVPPSAERRRALQEFWELRLGDPMAATLLSTDRPRGPRRGFEGQRIERWLDAETEAGIAGLARRLGTTPFAILLATTARWLTALGAGSRPRVGVPLADRAGADGDLLGCFVDPLPMAVAVAEAPGFEGLVELAGQEVRGVMGHRGWSVADLAQRFDPGQDPSRPSVFQVMLVDYTLGLGSTDDALGAFALGRPGGRLALSEGDSAAALESVATTSGGLGYEMVVASARIDGRRVVRLDYDPQLFDATTAERWIDLWTRGLVVGLARPEAPTTDGGLLSATERHQLTVGWQTPALSPPADGLESDVPTAVLRWARERPEALALSSGDVRLGWGELAERSARLAVALRRLGVGRLGREGLVALGLGPCLDAVVLWLAVWRAGGAVLPVDPDTPPQRLASLLAEARPVLTVLTEAALEALDAVGSTSGEESPLAPLWQRGGPEFVGLGGLEDRAPSVAELASFVASSEGPALDLPAFAEQLAYVIHTSGSTGSPKRVGISHGGLRRLVAWHADAYGIGPDDRASQVAAPTFDATVWELWPHLAAGASVHLAPSAIRAEPRRLTEWLRHEAITVSFLPTPVAEEALAEPWLEGSALRLLLTGGDRLHRAPEGTLGFQLINHYGPTEATVVATCGPVDGGDARGDAGHPPIGRPLPSVRVDVVDALGDLCPVGIPGQLTLAGATLARGYLGDAATTATRFVPDPLASEPGGRRYLTGDRVRWRSDGQLDFLGRIDHQVQLRGRRLELGEIEATLGSHPQVREAVVSAVGQDGAGATGPAASHLVAWVVADEGSTPEALRADLLRHLAERLPAALRPQRLELRSGWPRTRHGKIDRRALAAEAKALQPDLAAASPAEGATERWLQELMAAVLDRPLPGLDDDFFALGGHSLLGARLLTRIREGSDADVHLADLFETPTVRGLAERLRGAAERPGANWDLGHDGAGACGPVPLTPGQERIWFLDRLQPGWPTHNVPLAITLDGPLDPIALGQAVHTLRRRHPMLRARLVEIAGRPHQEVVAADAIPATLTELDLRSRTPAAAQEALGREARRPFDLASPSLLTRALLARLDTDRAILLLVAHHLVFDGTSLRTVLGDLVASYVACEGFETTPPETHLRNSEVGGRRNERAQAERPPTPGLDSTKKTPPIDATSRPVGVGEREEPTPELGTPEAGIAASQISSRYLAYARRQQRPKDLATQLEAWRHHLDGAPQVLDLPTRRRRPDRRSPAGRRTEAEIPSSVTQAVADQARRFGSTRFLVQLAAFAVLLRRLTGVRDLVLGVPRIHRPAKELENVVGLFLDALVLRLDVSGNPTFGEIVGRARGELLAADRRADVPFESLVEALQPSRDPRVDPVFQVLFSSDEAVPSPTAGGVRFTPDLLDTGTAKLDLSLLVFSRSGEQGEREVVVTETRSDLVDADEAERWLGAYGRLLTAAVADPERRLAELDPWSRAERHQLTVGWQRPETSSELWWLARWLEQVERRPEAPAVEVAAEQETRWPRSGLEGQLDGAWGSRPRLRCAAPVGAPDSPGIARGQARRLSTGRVEGEIWSHRRLLGHATAIAQGLRERGLEREALVAVSLGPTPERLAVLLGILLAGGAYLPLDPEYPAARRRWMLDDSGARWWVAEDDADLDDEAGTQPKHVEQLDAASLVSAGSGPLPEPLPESLAYRIYTSGSTGLPKGVDVPHRAVGNFLASMAETPGLVEGDRLLAATPLSFDISVLEHFLPLVTGGTVVLARPGSTSDPEALAQQLDTSNARFFQATPTTLRPLLDTPWRGEGLRLGSGGEPLAADLAEALVARSGELWNLYGPTETTVWSSVDRVRPGEPPTLGRPIAGTTLHVLDRDGQRLGVGAVGELHIGGVGLARGYHRRPATTAERFVPDPWSDRPGSRLYATGDRVRRLGDGRLEGLGRLDSQVKVRGVRIEVGEIEAALHRLPEVADAVVTVAQGQDSADETRLVAHVQATEGAEVESRSLRDALLVELPRPLVPTLYRVLATFPRTPSGKVDRVRLARQATGEASAALPRSIIEPRNPLEATVHGIWSEVLGRSEPFGVDDDFFELGGHSLLAARVLARLRAELGVDLPLLAVFEQPTVAGLATAVQAHGRDAPGPIARLERPTEGVFEAQPTLAQRRLWLLDQLNGGGYVLSAALRLRGPLDGARLEAALASVVARHEALRTGFRPGADEPIQVIEAASSVITRVPLATVDLAALPAGRRSEVARRLAVAEGRRRFDLASPPLLRWLLLDLGESDSRKSESVVVFAIHHIVADGGSLAILVREVAWFYDHLATESRVHPALPLPTVQPADFAHWQRRWLAEAEIGPALDTWRHDLAEVPALDLPTDRRRPRRPTAEGGLVRFVLDTELHRGLREVARHQGATLFMALQAVFQVLIGRLAGQRDFAVGSPRADRPRPELEGVIGLWVETLVIRADLEGRPSFAEVLDRVRRRNLEAFARPRIPFEKLVETLALGRGGDVPPIFQVLLGWQEAPLADLDWAGLEVSPFEVDGGLANFDLALIVEPTASGGLKATWEYRRQLFDPATLVRLGQRFERLARALVAEPTTPIDAADWLGQGERHQLLHAGLGQVPEADPAALLTPFLDHAREHPDYLAGFDGERSWTYGELREGSERLAQVLRSVGAGPGSWVLVLAEGGFEQAVSLLAVFRCGAAFLAFDPDGSAAWGASVLAEARPAVALVEDRLRERLVELGWPDEGSVVVCDPASFDDHEGADSMAPLDRIDPALPAYLVYTSGSSGRPKGIVQSRRTLAQLVTWFGEVAELEPGDRLSRWSAVSYDAATVELFAALGRGAAVVQASAALRSDPRRVPQWLHDHGVSHFQTVPSVAREVLAAVRDPADPGAEPAEGWARDRLPRLRWLALAGEVLAPELASDWRRALGRGGELLNLYGPTESILASWQRLDTISQRRAVPVGRAIPGRRLAVVDGLGEPAGIGMPGEVVVAGEALTPGYWQRPAATAEVFRPDPEGDGARRYHTGDRGRLLADGSLDFLGRRDSQIKLRGVRVEPGEVEAVLRRHPEVADCVVVPWGDAAGGLQLWAYTTLPSSGGTLPSSGDSQSSIAVDPDDAVSDPEPRIDNELRAYAAELLPRALVPAAVVILGQLPRTRNGKVDRRALPSPESFGGQAQGRSEPPRGATEERVAAVWRRVLDRAPDGPKAVGRDDDFFQLGGHSLLATRLLREVAEATGVEVPLRVFFERPTVAAVAARVEAEQGETQEDLETILQTIEDVEQLSEDEVSTLLGVGDSVEGSA